MTVAATSQGLERLRPGYAGAVMANPKPHRRHHLTFFPSKKK